MERAPAKSASIRRRPRHDFRIDLSQLLEELARKLDLIEHRLPPV
jgi:hypothetical protein